LAGAAVTITAIRIAQVKSKLGMPLLVGICLTPFIIYFLINSQYRVMFAHGFFHLGITYQIMNGIVPPMDPIFAGQPVLYPWGYHWLIANVSSVTGIAPDITFFVLSMISLALTVMLVYIIVLDYASSHITAIFGVLIAIFGVSILNSGPAADFVNQMMLPVLNFVDVHFLSRINLDLPYDMSLFTLGERRVRLPIKYLQLEGSSFGIVFVALFVFSIMRVFSLSHRSLASYFLFGLALLGAGFFYPMFWSGLIGSLVFIVSAMGYTYGKSAARSIAIVLAVAGCTTLVLLPYLLQITAGKPPEASIVVNKNIWLIIAKTIRYSWGMLPILLLIVWQRRFLMQRLFQKDAFVICALAMSLGTFAMYILLVAPEHTEYKYYILSWLSAGIVAAIPMRKLLDRKYILAIVYSSILLFPLSFDLFTYSLESGPFSDPFYRDGVDLRHEDRSEDELYRFLLENTEPQDIVVDSHLTVPVFAQRALLVGLDSRRASILAGQQARGDQFGDDSKPMDGWRNPAASFIKLNGYPGDDVARRVQLASDLLSQSEIPFDQNTFRELDDLTIGRKLFVVLRGDRPASRYGDSKKFSKIYVTDGAEIYRYD
jgi:Uncharacterized membrane protein (DUF2298)